MDKENFNFSPDMLLLQCFPSQEMTPPIPAQEKYLAFCIALLHALTSHSLADPVSAALETHPEREHLSLPSVLPHPGASQHRLPPGPLLLSPTTDLHFPPMSYSTHRSLGEPVKW